MAIRTTTDRRFDEDLDPPRLSLRTQIEIDACGDDTSPQAMQGNRIECRRGIGVIKDFLSYHRPKIEAGEGGPEGQKQERVLYDEARNVEIEDSPEKRA